jgi:hypothetical protein
LLGRAGESMNSATHNQRARDVLFSLIFVPSPPCSLCLPRPDGGGAESSRRRGSSEQRTTPKTPSVTRRRVPPSPQGRGRHKMHARPIPHTL